MAVESPDPHASKIPADDPRLRIERPRPRALKKGPALAAVFGLFAVVTVALAAGLTPTRSGGEADKEKQQVQPPTPLDQAFSIPDAIKNAPDNNTPILPSKPPAVPQLGEPQTGNLGRTVLPAPGADAYGPAHAPGLARAQQNVEEVYKARSSGLFFNGDDSGASDVPSSAAGRAVPAAFTPAAAAAAPPGAGALQAAGERSEPNLQDRKNDFLARTPKSSGYLEEPVTGPRSPFEVKAGTIIPTVLVTGINSDLPGQVIGQVRENVYDTLSGNHLLIPQGSRLLASYDSMIAFGQERVLVCWSRLIRPDGISVNLECMPGVDLAGYAGFGDRVDHHWWRIIAGVALGSLLSAGAASSQGNVTTLQPTFPQLWAQGAAAGVAQAGQQITQKNINIQPTITVRPGFSVNVLVSKDIVIPPYAAVR